MSEIWKSLLDVVLAPTIVALITIFIVGCFKFIPGLKNIKSSTGRKAVFQLLSFAWAGLLSTLYHLFILKGGWNIELLSFIGTAIAEVNIIYPLYENFGLRDLVKKIISLLAPSKAKKLGEVVDGVADVVEEKITSSQEVAEKQEKAKKTGWLE